MGVSLFAEVAPDDFQEFNRAFIAMFRVTAGETWVPSLPKVDPDGSINWQAASFIVSFIIIENWMLFQVALRPRVLLSTLAPYSRSLTSPSTAGFSSG